MAEATTKATKTATKSIYSTLSKIDVSPYLEKKTNLDYLSWAKAWGLVKQAYPDASYKITEFPEYIQTKDGWVATGRDVDYRQTQAGYEVEAVVTIEGHEYSSKLFVMDYHNRALAKASYFEINKTQQRAMVKALAIAGLGLNVYAGEDLPSAEDTPQKKAASKPASRKQPAQKSASSKPAAAKQPVQSNTITDLRNYTVNYNGQLVPMHLVVKHASEGNKEANNFANSLKGRDLEVFTELAKNGIIS